MAKKMVETLEENVKEAKEEKTTEKKTPAKKAAAKKTTKKDEIKEEVKEEILQEALNQTIQKYPVFLSVMRKGLFWHYLEKSELRPVVREEYKEPCSSLYVRDKKDTFI